MHTVECTTLFGEKKEVPVSELSFRPSVYGIARQEGMVLLIKTSVGGFYEFPGGGIELGETMEEALKREMLEEAGIEVEMGEFLLFRDNLFYYDPNQEAYHTFLFMYECKPLSMELSPPHMDVDNKKTEEPVWAEIANLKEGQFAGADRVFFNLLREKGVL